MKICSYCGKENGDAMLFCTGCGTTLSVPDETNPAPEKQSNVLGARSATIILLVFLIAQIFFGAMLAMIVASGIHTPNQQWDSQVPTVMFLTTVLAGVAMVYVSIVMIPGHLKDTRPSGAAWILGRPANIAKALVIGLVVAIFAHVANKAMGAHISRHGSSTLARIFTENPTQKLWYIGGILLAPLPEELLFRGILYGGYQKSFGSVCATITTTVIFLLFHLPKVIYSLPSIAGIIGLGLVALWSRLHFKAIGPAVALHFGYNAVLVIFAFSETWR